MGGRYASYWNASLLDENYEKTRLCYVSSADLTNLIHVWFVKEIELSHVPRPHLSEFNSFEVSRNASKKTLPGRRGRKQFYQYTNRNFRFKMCGISDTWYIPFEILVNIRVFPTLNWYNYINLRKKHCVDQWSKITKAIGCFRWIHFSFQLY